MRQQVDQNGAANVEAAAAAASPADDDVANAEFMWVSSIVNHEADWLPGVSLQVCHMMIHNPFQIKFNSSLFFFF